jgi:hypothetical protein
MVTRISCWSWFAVAVTLSRPTLGQQAPAPVVSPVCEWGNCAPTCEGGCPAGSVCGVSGSCVEIVSPQVIVQRVTEVEEERADELRSNARRQRARNSTRISVGAGVGGVTLVGGEGKAGVFVAELGLRKQLTMQFGLHAQITGALGLRYETDESGGTKRLTLYELEGSVSPYFGPFGRFYVGPAVLVGYRWYSDAFVQWFAPTTKIQDQILREGGFRLGILAGNEEQFDISALFTSSFGKDTPQRGFVTFAYEFR